MTTKYFRVIEVPYNNKYYFITGTDAFYEYFKWTDSSYNIYQARVMGLTYASYLRMARDLFNAEVHGKKQKYPSASFKEKRDAEKLAKILNERLSYLIEKRK